MAMTSDRGKTGMKNWWPRKKKVKENKIVPKIDASWINELVGDKRICRDKPSAWSSAPQIGMDKIRATTNAGKYFVNFASSSTVHGLNHLTAPHRHPIERFLAVLFIGGALTSLILLSINFWGRYQNEAFISVLDSDYRNFVVAKPAILFCPVLKYDEEKFSQVFKRHGIKDTRQAREFFAYLSNSSYREWDRTPIYDEVPPEKWLTILWELKGDVETAIALKENWIITEKGICLTYYTQTGVYSSYEYWMQNNWTIVPLPEEIPSLRFEEREVIEPFKFITHAVTVRIYHPVEIPDLERLDILIERRHISAIEINALEMKTSDAVKSLSVHQRKCKKIDEGGLKMWPIYTHGMCIQECKYELIRESCGCYPHFARPMAGISICTATQLRCVGARKREFVWINTTTAKICGCLPNCDTGFYEYHLVTDTALKEGSPMDALVRIHVDFPVETIRRELLFGFNDFLTSVGGAAGLFLGASVISFVEIIYYATLRLFWYRIEIKREKERKLKKKEEKNVTTKKKLNLRDRIEFSKRPFDNR